MAVKANVARTDKQASGFDGKDRLFYEDVSIMSQYFSKSC